MNPLVAVTAVLSLLAIAPRSYDSFEPEASVRLPTVRVPAVPAVAAGERMAPLPMLTAPLAEPEPPKIVLVPVTVTAPVPVPEPEVLFASSVPAVTKVPPV